jgi:hypothetical protein
VWVLGRHRLVCGDSTDPAVVEAVLAGVRPHLMVTDPPYGVLYDPAWRNAALPLQHPRTGKVLNDHRADWREAWALFPGDVAYVWHGALHATTVAESLTACGFEIRAQIVWAKERLVMGRGHYHWQHEPCWYAVRGGATGHWSGDRKQTTLWPSPAGDQDADHHPRHAEAGGVHAPADREQLLARPGRLRALQRIRHHDHRGRDVRPRLPCGRAVAGLRRCGGAALAGLHGRIGGAGGRWRRATRPRPPACRGGPRGWMTWPKASASIRRRAATHVRMMSGYGIPQEDIATFCDIDVQNAPQTFPRRARPGLDRGDDEGGAIAVPDGDRGQERRRRSSG